MNTTDGTSQIKSEKKSAVMDTEQEVENIETESGGLLRLWQIVGDKRRGISGIIPVSKSTWWAGIKKNRYPRGIKISPRCTAWLASDINKLIARVKNNSEGE